MNESFFLIDFRLYFLPAARAILCGLSPYTIPGFFNPPWALLPILPLAFLPDGIAGVIYLFMATFSLLLVLQWRGCSPIQSFLFLLSPPVVWSLVVGNLEWMVLLGMFLPRPIGILLLLAKPQVGIGVVVYWVIEAYTKRDIRGLLWMGTSLLIAVTLSIGFGPLHFVPGSLNHTSSHAFPWLIPAGIYLLYRAIRDRSPLHALSSSPCFSPYLSPGSWAGVQFAFAREPWWVVGLMVAGEWGALLWGGHGIV